VPRHADVVDRLAGDLHHADAIRQRAPSADVSRGLETITQSRFRMPFSAASALPISNEQLGLQFSASHGSQRLHRAG